MYWKEFTASLSWPSAYVDCVWVVPQVANIDICFTLLYADVVVSCKHRFSWSIFFIILFWCWAECDEEVPEASCFKRTHWMISSSGNPYSKRENGLTSFETKDLELQVDGTHLILPNSVLVRNTVQVWQLVLLRDVNGSNWHILWIYNWLSVLMKGESGRPWWLHGNVCEASNLFSYIKNR